MIVDSDVITSAMQAARAIDKPAFIARNVLNRSTTPVTGGWRVSGSFLSGTDITEEDYPINRVWDGYGDLPTKPTVDAIASDTVALILNLHSVVTFDALALFGANLDEFDDDTTVTVQVAEEADFSDAVTLVTFECDGATKRFAAVLNDQYQDVEYMRVVFTRDGDDLPAVPEIGELYIGEQIQLARRPNRPWDPGAVVSSFSTATTKTGASADYFRYVGQARLAPTWEPRDGLDTGLNDADSLRLLHRRSSGGRYSVVFIDAPTTSPDEAMLMKLRAATFSMPEQDVALLSAQLELEEEPPFLWSEQG